MENPSSIITKFFVNDSTNNDNIKLLAKKSSRSSVLSENYQTNVIVAIDEWSSADWTIVTKAISDMRKTTLRAIKGLVRDRVLAEKRSQIERRYSNLLHMVADASREVDYIKQHEDDEQVKALYAKIYWLENEYNVIRKHHLRLIDVNPNKRKC